MKMPVGETLEGAFGFLFRNIISVIGTFWFPYLVAGAIIGGAVYLTHPDFSAFTTMGPNGDPKAALAFFQQFRGVFTLGWLVLLIVGSMVRVGLLRKALGLHEGPVLIYFSLGAPVWRMLGANILLGILAIAVVIAAIAGCGAVFVAAGASLKQPLLGLVDTIAVVLAIFVPLYVILRFMFFLGPVVVAEERIGLGRAWSLGGGNVLRAIVVVIAISVAVGIVFSILSSFVLPPLPIAAMQQPPNAQTIFNLEMQMLRKAGPLLVVLWTLQILFTEGLLAGAMASGYRAVTGTAKGTS